MHLDGKLLIISCTNTHLHTPLGMMGLIPLGKVLNVNPHYTLPKIITCSKLMKTGCNNVVLPTLFVVVNNIVQHC